MRQCGANMLAPNVAHLPIPAPGVSQLCSQHVPSAPLHVLFVLFSTQYLKETLMQHK